MKTPLFITSSRQMPPNWAQAFPGATHVVGLPDKFDSFDSSMMVIDYMNLSAEERPRWLERCVQTRRKVIVLSPTPEVNEAIAVIKAGALGYGHTLAAPERLREMVLVVDHGGLWVGSKLMKTVLAAIAYVSKQSEGASRPCAAAITAQLSEREKAVARYVARGATNPEIAVALDIKERTVKAHITSLFDKLKVRNRVELALLLNNVPIDRSAGDNQLKRRCF